jgi:hypothetical protein
MPRLAHLGCFHSDKFSLLKLMFVLLDEKDLKGSKVYEEK